MSEPPRLPRRGVTLGLVAALAGCGFTPVYAPGTEAASLRGAVAPKAPATRAAYALATRLEDRLGPAPAPTFRLGYTITLDTEDQAISPDQRIQRIALLGTVDYTLTEIASGRIVTSGRISDFTGYNTTGTTVATRTAERDAEARLMVILADRIVEELALRGGDAAR